MAGPRLRLVSTTAQHFHDRNERSVYASSFYTSPRRLFSPNGAATQSPGLVRLRTYPGCVNATFFNPNEVAAQNDFTHLRHGRSQPLRG
jgi:hypothetical protein